MLDHFRESQRSEPAPVLMLAFASALEVVGAFVQHIVYLRVTCLIISALFLGLALSARQLTIRVRGKVLVFGFGPFQRRIHTLQILDMRVVDTLNPPRRPGVRKNLEGKWEWIAKPGTAVELLISDEKQIGYIISTSRPRDLITALETGKTGQTADAP